MQMLTNTKRVDPVIRAENRDTIFYFNRLEGYIPVKK